MNLQSRVSISSKSCDLPSSCGGSLMSTPTSTLLLLLSFLFFFFSLSPSSVTSDVVLESGYWVSTAVDFNKLPSPSIHPFALFPRHRPNDLLLLDSINSAFYSLPVPLSQESEVSIFSGRGGTAGFSDGDRTTAMFDKPRSFALDGKDNVYVADRSNRAIRKISPSGVTTTIAGGQSTKSGHIDGPAQNASFSNDFDLVYVPTLCALLVSDRGNRLIRQMDLKPEDCVRNSQSGLGVAPISMIASLSLLIGLVLGFVVRPFFTSRGISGNHFASKMWKHYQANLGRVAATACSAIKNAVASSTLYELMHRLVNMTLCYLSVVFRNIMLSSGVQYNSKKTPIRNRCEESVSLLESDIASDRIREKPQNFAGQLRDLISFDEGVDVLEVNMSSEEKIKTEDDLKGSTCMIDDMIKDNLLDFGSKRRGQLGSEELPAYGLGLVQRRLRDVDGL